MGEDPRCPSCEGKVSATAQWCMHCGADVEDVDERTPAATTETSVGDEYGADATVNANVPDESGSGAATDADVVRESGSADSGPSAATANDGNRLDPDGLLDNSLTVVVGVVAGVVLGFLALFLVGFTTESAWSLAVALVVWIGSTAVIARERTVFGAIRTGSYATAFLLVALPLVAFAPTSGGDLAGRLSAFLVGEFAPEASPGRRE